MTKRIITEEQVIQHIRTHMDIWCKSYGSHVLEKHVNIPEKTMLSRIGTTENNHFIKASRRFMTRQMGSRSWTCFKERWRVKRSTSRNGVITANVHGSA